MELSEAKLKLANLGADIDFDAITSNKMKRELLDDTALAIKVVLQELERLQKETSLREGLELLSRECRYRRENQSCNCCICKEACYQLAKLFAQHWDIDEIISTVEKIKVIDTNVGELKEDSNAENQR